MHRNSARSARPTVSLRRIPVARRRAVRRGARRGSVRSRRGSSRRCCRRCRGCLRASRGCSDAAVDDAENLFTPFVVARARSAAVAERGNDRCAVDRRRCAVRLAGSVAVRRVSSWPVGAPVRCVAPHDRYQPSRVVDALCLAFMVAYTTPLCALGYEETMRMHRMRERLRIVSGELELQRDRLSRYVAAPVAARSTKAPLERRWLTVAFVDISDFTALTERLEPEDLTSLLDGFLRGARRTGGALQRQSAQVPGRRRADQLRRCRQRRPAGRRARVRRDARTTRMSDRPTERGGARSRHSGGARGARRRRVGLSARSAISVRTNASSTR